MFTQFLLPSEPLIAIAPSLPLSNFFQKLLPLTYFDFHFACLAAEPYQLVHVACTTNCIRTITTTVLLNCFDLNFSVIIYNPEELEVTCLYSLTCCKCPTMINVCYALSEKNIHKYKSSIPSWQYQHTNSPLCLSHFIIA